MLITVFVCEPSHIISHFLPHRIFKNDAGKMPTSAELDALLDRSGMLAAAAAAQQGAKGKAKVATFSAAVSATGEEGAEEEEEGGGAASGSAALLQPVGGGAAESLQDVKHSALDFNAEEKPLSSFMLVGQRGGGGRGREGLCVDGGGQGL